jgi:hypothetical protein
MMLADKGRSRRHPLSTCNIILYNALSACHPLVRLRIRKLNTAITPASKEHANLKTTLPHSC